MLRGRRRHLERADVVRLGVTIAAAKLSDDVTYIRVETVGTGEPLGPPRAVGAPEHMIVERDAVIKLV